MCENSFRFGRLDDPFQRSKGQAMESMMPLIAPFLVMAGVAGVPVQAKLYDFNIRAMRPGIYGVPWFSSFEVSDKTPGAKGQLSLVATDEVVPILGEFRGMRVFLVNRTKDSVRVVAFESTCLEWFRKRSTNEGSGDPLSTLMRPAAGGASGRLDWNRGGTGNGPRHAIPARSKPSYGSRSGQARKR